MNNYEYCAQWAVRTASGGRVLDYGCGAGELVSLLLQHGMDAIGCDRYYEGNDWSNRVPVAIAPRVMRMHTDRIPFEDGSFDCVISNQVLEHVPDLDVVLAEIARVLKRGGKALHLFPHRGVWIEPHVKIPFIHWLPSGSLQHAYACLWRPKHARMYCDYLKRFTYYRTWPEIRRSFERYGAVRRQEREWFRARRGPFPFETAIARRYAGVVLEHTHRVSPPAFEAARSQ